MDITLANMMERAPVEGLLVPPEDASETLDSALSRYLVLSGAVDDDSVAPEQAAADVRDHGHIRKVDADGHPRVCERDMVEFMRSVTGLPHGWCVYRTYRDWLELVQCGAVRGDTAELVREGYRNALELTAEAAGETVTP